MHFEDYRGRLAVQLDIFSPKTPPLIGLDISSSSVKMVELVDAGKGQHRIERYCIEPLPKDAVVDGNIANLEAVSEAVSTGSASKKRAHVPPPAAVVAR